MTNRQAMLCALVAYFLWVLGDAAIKFGGLAALSPFLIMAILGLVGAAALAAFSFFNGTLSALKPRSLRDQTQIAATRTIINYVNIIALSHLPLTMFYAVVFTIPLMVAALSAMLKYETLTPTKIVCIIAGFLGTLLAIGVHGGGDWKGYLAAFISAVCFSVSVILMRRTAKTETAESTQFMIALGCSIVGLFGLLGKPFPAPDSGVVVALVVAGVINIVGGVLYVRAVHNTASTNVTQLHYTQIISGGILGYLIWNEIPTWNLIVGSIIIIAAGLVVAAQAKKNDLPQ